MQGHKVGMEPKLQYIEDDIVREKMQVFRNKRNNVIKMKLYLDNLIEGNIAA